MGEVVIVIVAAIALLGIGWAAALLARRARPGDEGSEEVVATTRPRPEVAEFHVRGEEAVVTFAVPLPEGEVDQVLKDLLLSEAIEVVREKRHHQLPIDQVHRVRAFGTRNGEPALVGVVDLDVPGELPPPAVPDLVPHASKVGFDPLTEYADSQPHAPPQIAEVAKEERLPSIGAEVQLAARVEAGLRGQGIDPATMSAGEMVLGVLRIVGYTVTEAEKPTTYFASRMGQRTYIRVVDHTPGDYPELPEQIVNEFMVNFVSSGANRGLLITDKYAPYAIYDKERREPRVKYVSRERLQHFLDAVTVA